MTSYSNLKFMAQRIVNALSFEKPVHSSYGEGIELGIAAEREAVIEILQNLPFRWDGDRQVITLDKRDVIALIERANE